MSKNMKEFRRFEKDPICKICYNTSESSEKIKNDLCEKFKIRCICISCKTPCVSNPCEKCWIEKGLKPPESRNCISSILEEKKYTTVQNSLLSLKSKICSFFEELYLINSLIESNKEINYNILKNQFKKVNIELLIKHDYLILEKETVKKGKNYLKSLPPKKINLLTENPLFVDVCIYASIYDIIKISKFKKNGLDITKLFPGLTKYGFFRKLKNFGLYRTSSWFLAQLKKINENYTFEELQADELIKVFAVT